MKNFLTPEEQESLKAQHRLERDKRVCYRINAILLANSGWGYKEISNVLFLSDETVKNHIQDYLSNQKLKPENGGSESKLNKTQTESLLTHLEQHCYLYAKDIVQYVKTTFGIAYTVPGMICWLKSHGFSYKKPAIVPGKANRMEQEAWISQYQDLKKNLPGDEAICFIDGVHPTHNVKVTYGWIKKGKRQEIPSNTGRRRLNLSGMIDIFSKNVLFQEDGSLNAESTIAFLKKIESAYPLMSKIHLFCDNARYYKNAAVKEFLKGSKIQMHFLPPYSPNLNSIERLWKILYEEVFYNRYYENFIDFKEAVYGFLKGLKDPCQEIFERISRRVTDNFRAIQGAFKENYGAV